MSENAYIVKDTPDKGKSMFAARDIKRGELIIAESPLVYIPEHNEAESIRAVEALSKKNKKYFYALHSVYSEDEMSLIYGIVRTNAFPLGPDSPDSAVYRVISRINHSCVPNVKHKWNPTTGKEHVTAIKDIPEGSEILTAYQSPLKTRAERHHALRAFRFQCQCPLCTSETSDEYDMAIKRIEVCSKLIETACAANRPRDSITYVREVLALYDKIGASGKTPYYYDGFQICAMYSNFDLAQEWADRLLQSCISEEGVGSRDYAKFLAYML
ncbi:hypothetical protein BGX34_006874 [Mortierella sp. NVP85]|nr:hypothetical protein BGX34_006874 [Mortierella sp. NVP85]